MPATTNDVCNGNFIAAFADSQEQELSRSGLLKVKQANKWMKEAADRPVPRMLFDGFWFENELCILFADTNLGKSVLAVQIADSISRNQHIHGFQMQAGKQVVLYLDCELSDKQFEQRYSNNYKNHYRFSTSLIRAEIDSDSEVPEKMSFETFLSESLERAIVTTSARILIIDNVTYLRTETERAKEALPLMKHLKSLKSKYNLSILILAHTPKRDISKPLTRNDLQGSKMLINFCDSAFAIGESFKDKGVRYIKQIKARNIEMVYDARNICVCQINKPSNFLRFEFLHHGTETDHLRIPTDESLDELENQIIDLYENGKKSQKDIAEELDTYPMKVSRVIRQHEADKELRKKGVKR